MTVTWHGRDTAESPICFIPVIHNRRPAAATFMPLLQTTLLRLYSIIKMSTGGACLTHSAAHMTSQCKSDVTVYYIRHHTCGVTICRNIASVANIWRHYVHIRHHNVRVRCWEGGGSFDPLAALPEDVNAIICNDIFGYKCSYYIPTFLYHL